MVMNKINFSMSRMYNYFIFSKTLDKIKSTLRRDLDSKLESDLFTELYLKLDSELEVEFYDELDSDIARSIYKII